MKIYKGEFIPEKRIKYTTSYYRSCGGNDSFPASHGCRKINPQIRIFKLDENSPCIKEAKKENASSMEKMYNFYSELSSSHQAQVYIPDCFTSEIDPFNLAFLDDGICIDKGIPKFYNEYTSLYIYIKSDSEGQYLERLNNIFIFNYNVTPITEKLKSTPFTQWIEDYLIDKSNLDKRYSMKGD